VCVCVCVEDFDIKRKITHFFFPSLFVLLLLFVIGSAKRCQELTGMFYTWRRKNKARKKETCFFYLILFFSKSNDPPVTFYSCEETLNARGETRNFFLLSHTAWVYWEVSFFSFLLFLPLLLGPSVQVRRLWRLDHFFFIKHREIIYLFIICFCGNVLSVPMTVVERLSNK
jgi:hypothetical protein